jgi:SNF2 family DNA or RNA helicase
MNSILHGTWIVNSSGQADELFFVWAERAAAISNGNNGHTPRIQRHPYAATSIEIASLLSTYVPDTDWPAAERLTRIALLPSDDHAPVMPRWMMQAWGDEENHAAEPHLVPWRIEGIGVPILHMLDVLAALPARNHQQASDHQLGTDLRYWGLAAKFALELLARGCFIPGLRAEDGTVHGAWLPIIDDPRDQARLQILIRNMPPVCRALFRERNEMSPRDGPQAQDVLHSFLGQIIDSAVRDWAPLSPQAARLGIEEIPRFQASPHVSQVWWQSLWANKNKIEWPTSREQELTRFYQAWQSWTHRAQPAADAAFRLCFRLEPPEFDGDSGRVVSPDWVVRYFLQAHDDPSLLVPAQQVWCERGSTLSYLNHRFDQPQEKLLAGLGMAARLCPAIERSLKSQCPESATLTAQEAYTFLRETARLLEGVGLGVMVPPWWNKPDTRLRVRIKMRSKPESGSGLMGLHALISYDWELALGDEPLTREEFERLAALKTPLVQVRGRWVLLQPDQVEAAIAFWEKQRERGDLSMAEALRVALGAQTEIDGLALGDVELDEDLAQLLERLGGGDQIETLPSPSDLHGQLRPYQNRGFSWLAFLRQWGFGACLADDMGLGKTIQAISLLLHTRNDNGSASGPSLVVCPTSVVGNWQREVTRFAPTLRVLVHHGSGRAGGEDLIQQTHENDLVISTYGLVRRDLDDLVQVHWSNVILDEAQNIKNPITQQARAIRRLKGKNRVALTGTPVENHLSELWSIMSFLNPGYLGSLEGFRRTFAVPIERYQDMGASERLRTLVRPFILRRLKTDPLVIQDLPDKFEYKVYSNLTREQATLYEAVVRDSMAQLQDLDPVENTLKRRGLVLSMLLRLKQVCNHPALYLGDGSETGQRSGKLNRLTEMIEEVLAVGDHALVFTQFARMGTLLQHHLQGTFGQEVLFLHGGTPQKQRDHMLQRFQEDPGSPHIFVLSLKAGGTGLNLMRANHVFHYDRWWNPAVEDQATDRAYRIGQTRDVQVQKFICLGTLEERIDMLIESKRALADSIVSTGEEWLTELNTEQLHDLITLRSEAVEID